MTCVIMVWSSKLWAIKNRTESVCYQAGARSGPCNQSYCEAGIWGWLEDGSPPWRLLVPLWRPHLAQDQFCTTRGVRVGHGGGVVVKKDPCQTEFQFCRVPRMGGIKLQLLCGVRIELAVGSLPYPGKSGFPIVSPGRDRPLSGFPICKPCLDVRQNPSRDTHFPSYGRRPPNQNQPTNQTRNCTLF